VAIEPTLLHAEHLGRFIHVQVSIAVVGGLDLQDLVPIACAGSVSCCEGGQERPQSDEESGHLSNRHLRHSVRLLQQAVDAGHDEFPAERDVFAMIDALNPSSVASPPLAYFRGSFGS